MAVPLNAFCKFANATAAAAQPLPRKASQESESESESPHDLAARVAWRAGAMARLHTLALTARRGGGGKATALKRFLASQSFLLLCEFCAKVHQGGGHDGKPSTAVLPCRQAKRWPPPPQRQLSAEMARIAILGPARICNVLRALHSAKHSDNSPSLRRSTVTCN